MADEGFKRKLTAIPSADSVDNRLRWKLEHLSTRLQKIGPLVVSYECHE